jgi:molybdopterin-binding protein
MLCVPGSKPDCGVFREFQTETEKPLEKAESVESAAVVTNTGIMNRLHGQIIDIDQGQIMTRVTFKVGDNFISSIMSTEDFLQSGKKLGDAANIAIKSFNVKLMV